MHDEDSSIQERRYDLHQILASLFVLGLLAACFLRIANGYDSPIEFNIGADIAPVYAPLPWGQTPSAPIESFPPTADWADSMKTYGTKRATSASGLDSVMDPAMPDANATASSFDCGLSFQLPEMNGFRS